MKVLLDTHFILWSLLEQRRLTTQARAIIDDPGNELLFSTASLWEIAIKRGLGKRDFYPDPRVLRHAMLKSDYLELTVLGEHAITVTELPPIHKDPFDRLLVAQCIVEGITLLTSDTVVARYPGFIQLV